MASQHPAADRTLWSRLKYLVSHHILGLDDTPHRIALGVALGFFVGMTPTLGVQMVIYFAIAAVVGANKISGIPPIWLSNPITAVPLYYSTWKIGHVVLTGDLAHAGGGGEAMRELLRGLGRDTRPLWQRLVDLSFWKSVLSTVLELGAELWVGSLLLGGVLGVLFYWITLRAVTRIRARKQQAEVQEIGP